MIINHFENRRNFIFRYIKYFVAYSISSLWGLTLRKSIKPYFYRLTLEYDKDTGVNSKNIYESLNLNETAVEKIDEYFIKKGKICDMHYIEKERQAIYYVVFKSERDFKQWSYLILSRSFFDYSRISTHIKYSAQWGFV